MQTANVNLPITVTGRHVSVTDAMRTHALNKVESLQLDYPKIIEAKVILDVEANSRHVAEIILYCANHITIEASSTTPDMYASIDETLSKTARRMRKYKTRMLKATHRPRKNDVKLLPEHVFAQDLPEEEAVEDVLPVIVHKESFRLRPLYTDEAIQDMELSEKPFVVFENAKNHRLSILFRRKDGDYAVIEPQA
ncbi:MAG: putative sigma-54 modulation protein [Verrucomicrobiales bacterium]|jgi:putative sigma-54 modulation protein